MKSVGEVMAMGRTFQESFQKALARPGSRRRRAERDRPRTARCWQKSWANPAPSASGTWAMPSRQGMSVDEVFALTKIDPWFLAQIEEIVKIES